MVHQDDTEVLAILDSPIEPGDSRQVVLNWLSERGGTYDLVIVLDDDGSGSNIVDECTRTNNRVVLSDVDFAEPSVMAAGLEGRPVYLALAMTEDGRLKLKPQNLLVNLPLAERA